MKLTALFLTALFFVAPAFAKDANPRMYFPKFSLNMPVDAEVISNIVQDAGDMRIQNLAAIFPFPKEHVAKMLAKAMTKFEQKHRTMNTDDTLAFVIEGYNGTPSSVRLDDYEGDNQKTIVTLLTVTKAKNDDAQAVQPKSEKAAKVDVSPNALDLYDGLMTFELPKGVTVEKMDQAINAEDTPFSASTIRYSLTFGKTLAVISEVAMTQNTEMVDAAYAIAVTSDATNSEIGEFKNKHGVSFTTLSAEFPQVGRQKVHVVRSGTNAVTILQISPDGDAKTDLIKHIAQTFKIEKQDLSPIEPTKTETIFGRSFEISEQTYVMSADTLATIKSRDPSGRQAYDFIILPTEEVTDTSQEAIENIAKKFQATIVDQKSANGWTATMLDTNGIHFEAHVIEVPDFGAIYAILQGTYAVPEQWILGRSYLKQLLKGIGYTHSVPDGFYDYKRIGVAAPKATTSPAKEVVKYDELELGYAEIEDWETYRNELLKSYGLKKVKRITPTKEIFFGDTNYPDVFMVNDGPYEIIFITKALPDDLTAQRLRSFFPKFTKKLSQIYSDGIVIEAEKLGPNNYEMSLEVYAAQ